MLRIPLNHLVCVTGCQRVGQVDAGAGRALPRRWPKPERQAGGSARRLQQHRGTRAHRRGGAGGSVADRQDHTLESGQLCRGTGRHSQAASPRSRCRRNAATPPAPSASIRAMGVARPVAATASNTWRCSSSPMSICAVPTATAGATATDVLEVKLASARRMSIADVLALTVDQAIEFFGDARDILRALEPLQAVGLGYLQLGQPVPTLSRAARRND